MIAQGSSKIFLELLKFVFCTSRHTFPTIIYGLLKWIFDTFLKRYRGKFDEKRIALKKQFEVRTEMKSENQIFLRSSSGAGGRRICADKTRTYLEVYSVFFFVTQDVLGDNGVLIYPTFVSAAHYPHQSLTKVANFSYMMIFNVLGLPVTQCPMGLNSEGLPIGLQVAIL